MFIFAECNYVQVYYFDRYKNNYMKPIFHNKNVKFHILIVLLTLFYSLSFTFSEFYGSPYSGFKDFVILFLQWGCVAFATYGLLLLLALNRYVFAVFFTPLTFLCSVLTYFRYTANITLTPMIIDLCVVNDIQTGMTLISFPLVLVMLLSVVLGVFITILRFRMTNPDYLLNLILGVGIVAVCNGLVPGLKRPVSERMPYSLYYNVSKYLHERKMVNAERPDFEGNVYCASDSITVVFVIGESLRADHLQLNGYARETTPLLSGDSSVVSFPHIYTEECYTHTSIPVILTRADSITPDRAYTERSFISLFRKAGFHTSWLANQESVKNYVYFMNECDTLIYANSGKSMYVFDKWLDSDLLPFYENELSGHHSRKFILLHTIGSHWWYESHYPDDFRKFEPVIKTRVVSSCTDEELINSYDNTIVYTDYIMSRLIKSLENRNAVLIYLSDHGESLGEDGMYLHGADHYTLHYPACFVWMSDIYRKNYPEKWNAVKMNSRNSYRTDFLFHSILSAADIHTDYIVDELNVFSNE